MRKRDIGDIRADRAAGASEDSSPGHTPCPMPESFYRLRSAGLMAGESARDVRLRCRLYALYLGRHLL